MDMKRPLSIARGPLVHFLLIGAGLFLLYGDGGSPLLLPRAQATAANAQVVVTQDDIDQMNQQFEKTWQHPPGEKERKAL